MRHYDREQSAGHSDLPEHDEHGKSDYDIGKESRAEYGKNDNVLLPNGAEPGNSVGHRRTDSQNDNESTQGDDRAVPQIQEEIARGNRRSIILQREAAKREYLRDGLKNRGGLQ